MAYEPGTDNERFWYRAGKIQGILDLVEERIKDGAYPEPEVLALRMTQAFTELKRGEVVKV